MTTRVIYTTTAWTEIPFSSETRGFWLIVFTGSIILVRYFSFKPTYSNESEVGLQPSSFIFWSLLCPVYGNELAISMVVTVVYCNGGECYTWMRTTFQCSDATRAQTIWTHVRKRTTVQHVEAQHYHTLATKNMCPLNNRCNTGRLWRRWRGISLETYPWLKKVKHFGALCAHNVLEH